MNKQYFQGKSSEHFVAFFLNLNGYRTSIVNQMGYDLITTVDNIMYKIEVKSSSRRIKNRKAFKFSTKQGKKNRKLSENLDSDIVAFVMIYQNLTPRIYFKPTFKITGLSHSIYDIHININMEIDTFNESIMQLGGN